MGVRSWERVAPALVRAQLDAVAEDLRPASFKTGMLGDAEVVRAVADGIRAYGLGPYVLDPVMVATSGDSLAQSDAAAAIVAELIPLCALVAPNLDEASILCGLAVRDVESMERAARMLVDKFGAGAALVKGGHLDSEQLVDVLFDGHSMHRLVHERVVTRNTHGTGCTLSAAIVAGLALGSSLEGAIQPAMDFVQRALRSAPGLGGGNGPLDFLA